MIRARENPLALKAGVFSALVHGLFFMLLVMTFSWKNVPPMQVAQVELWDSLPQPKVIEPEPTPEPPPPPKIEPEPEPAPPPEPKAEIQIKPKPPVPEVKKPPKEKPKPDPALKAAEQAKKKAEDLKRLQQLLAQDDQQLQNEAQQQEAKNAADAKRAAETLAASSGVVDEYKAKIVAKIKRNVNKQVCGTGKPELVFAIAMMPTGEVSGNPRLVKGSGLPACDQAVERAILQAQPLPLPPQPELFAQFRDLNLKFRPNDEQ
jgi:colicin import membrane protein